MDEVFRSEANHIWRFLKSGLLTLIVYYGFYLSLNGLGVWYIYSSWFASFSAAFCTFLVNKYFVFNGAKKSKTWVQVLQFFVAAIVARIANSLALFYLVEEMDFSKTGGQVLLTCVTAMCTYPVFRFLIFKEE
jgi:putative flippase GtrA